MDNNPGYRESGLSSPVGPRSSGLQTTHPTVSLQGLHQGVVSLGIKVQALVHLLEVQVLEGGRGLQSLLAVGPALVRGALQVVLVVHLERAREHVVHDHHADVHPAAVDVVEAVELGQ